MVATRHIWYTDFRLAFVPHIELLLNDDILVGTGVTSRETLRYEYNKYIILYYHNYCYCCFIDCI